MNKKIAIFSVLILLSFSFISTDCGPKPNQPENINSADPFPKEMLNHKIFKVFRGENRLGYTFRDESKQLFGTRYWQGQESTSPGTDQTVKFNKNQSGGLSTRLPSIGSIDANYKNAENFKVILKGLKIHELKQPALFDKYIDNDNAKTEEYIISMLSAEKIVIQIQNAKGANLDLDTGIADVFSTKLNYSKELEGMIAAENVFIGYITIKPSEDDLKRKASKSEHHKSSGSQFLQLAVHTPKNSTGDSEYDWLGSSMNNKIEMAFQRIPKFYVITSRKEDARYHVRGSYRKIGSRFEIDLVLTDSFRNNEQLLKYNHAIKIDTVDELYDYQISAVNAFVKPLGVKVKEEEKRVIKTAIKTTKSIDLVKLYEKASMLYGKAKYNEAYELLKKILSHDPNYIDAINRIGQILNDNAKYNLALKYYNKVFNLANNRKDKIWIAISYGNIGQVYDNQGKYEDALSYYFKALNIEEKVLGKEHPSTAISYGNIGQVYYNQGKYEDALSYYFKALNIEEKVLGKEHPSTATSYNNIGLIYHVQGKYEDALSYYFKALKIYEKVLGKEHPHTATNYACIGAVYKNQGKYEDALSYYFKALKIYEKVLGKEHPDTATSYNNIGALCYTQKKYKKALEYFLKSKRIRENKLGEEHPYTKQSYSWLSYVYKKLGDKKNADKYADMAK